MKSKGELARERIIKEALKLFAKKGVANTSFQEIAVHSKMKQPALFHYFDNKYSLFEACIEKVLGNFQDILDSSIGMKDHAGERLRKNFLANLEWLEKNPNDTALLIFLYYTSTHDEHFKGIYTRLLTRVRHRYAELIYSGIREGFFKLEVSPELASEILHELILGSLINFISAENEKREKLKLVQKWNFGVESVLGWNPQLK